MESRFTQSGFRTVYLFLPQKGDFQVEYAVLFCDPVTRTMTAIVTIGVAVFNICTNETERYKYARLPR